MYLSKEELQRMEQVDIRDVATEELVDISGIEIGYSDKAGTLNERMKQYTRKVAEIKY